MGGACVSRSTAYAPVPVAKIDVKTGQMTQGDEGRLVRRSDLDEEEMRRRRAAGESELAEKAAAKAVAEGAHAGRSYVYRVVLTGGPCAGKTSSLTHLTETLTSMGFDVYTVPEVATLMMNGGCRFPGAIDPAKLMEFESALLRLQLQSERTFLQVASSTGTPSVVFFDRGMFDIAAYLDPPQWEALLKRENLSTDYLQGRYDLVVHLVTAADGAETFYTKENNAARTETAEDARRLDASVEKAWAAAKQNGKHSRIDNSGSFKGKVDRATKAVLDMIESHANAIGECM
mmetsp:Transcript_128651/g.274554  ORF Transcript_128651/g.274554 Transcript_128651/m.274554 type:complete len:289 (+) Transcript_128651:158-1024(+)